MIKASVGLSDGRKLVVIGLSRENTEFLHAGKPIVVSTPDFGVPNGPEIMLYARETDDDAYNEIGQLFSGQDTTVIADGRGGGNG